MLRLGSRLKPKWDKRKSGICLKSIKETTYVLMSPMRIFQYSFFSNNFCKILRILFFFLFLYTCSLVSPLPTLGYCQDDSHTNPMLITALTFDPKITGSFITRLGRKSQPRTLWDLKREPSDSECNALIH